jgi:hypothetical protein
MRLSRYVLTQSTILTIENVDSRDSGPLAFEAIEGTTFLGKWIPSKATKNMGDLALDGGYCIPLCPKSLFRKE